MTDPGGLDIDELFSAAFKEMGGDADIADRYARLKGMMGAQLLALDFVAQAEVLPVFYQHCRGHGLDVGAADFASLVEEAIAHACWEQEQIKVIGSRLGVPDPADVVPGL